MATWWSTGAVAAAVAAVMVASGADRVAAQPAMGKETKPAAGMKDDTGMTPGGQGMEDDKKAMKDKKGTMMGEKGMTKDKGAMKGEKAKTKDDKGMMPSGQGMKDQQ